MTAEQRTPPRGPSGVPEYDELQRGQEQPPSVELLEPALSPQHPELPGFTVPIPDPGERPRAIRPTEPLDEGVGAAPHPTRDDVEGE